MKKRLYILEDTEDYIQAAIEDNTSSLGWDIFEVERVSFIKEQMNQRDEESFYSNLLLADNSLAQIIERASETNWIYLPEDISDYKIFPSKESVLYSLQKEYEVSRGDIIDLPGIDDFSKSLDEELNAKPSDLNPEEISGLESGMKESFKIAALLKRSFVKGFVF